MKCFVNWEWTIFIDVLKRGVALLAKSAFCVLGVHTSNGSIE
jgi:hypothetical protein